MQRLGLGSLCWLISVRRTGRMSKVSTNCSRFDISTALDRCQWWRESAGKRRRTSAEVVVAGVMVAGLSGADSGDLEA
jgi:hypothetical protein